MLGGVDASVSPIVEIPVINELPTTVRALVGFVVPMPTLPLEVTTNAEVPAPTCRDPTGFVVPIPTDLPVPTIILEVTCPPIVTSVLIATVTAFKFKLLGLSIFGVPEAPIRSVSYTHLTLPTNREV